MGRLSCGQAFGLLRGAVEAHSEIGSRLERPSSESVPAWCLPVPVSQVLHGDPLVTLDFRKTTSGNYRFLLTDGFDLVVVTVSSHFTGERPGLAGKRRKH